MAPSGSNRTPYYTAESGTVTIGLTLKTRVDDPEGQAKNRRVEIVVKK